MTGWGTICCRLGDGVSSVSLVGGDPLTTAHGTATVNGSEIDYAPNANYNSTMGGDDSFDYQVCDLDGDCSPATVTIHINAVNDRPVAVDYGTPGVPFGTTNDDTPTIPLDVLPNDSDPVEGSPLTVGAFTFTNGAHGTVTNNGTDVTYTPAPDWNGDDQFTYHANDGTDDFVTAATVATFMSTQSTTCQRPILLAWANRPGGAARSTSRHTPGHRRDCRAQHYSGCLRAFSWDFVNRRERHFHVYIRWRAPIAIVTPIRLATTEYRC